MSSFEQFFLTDKTRNSQSVTGTAFIVNTEICHFQKELSIACAYDYRCYRGSNL